MKNTPNLCQWVNFNIIPNYVYTLITQVLKLLYVHTQNCSLLGQKIKIVRYDSNPRHKKKKRTCEVGPMFAKLYNFYIFWVSIL